MLDAFISYSRADAAEVDAVVKCLKQLGPREATLWFDSGDSLQPGESWPIGIETGLEKCRATIVFCGTRGFGSTQEREVNAAMALVSERRSSDAPHKLVPVLLPGGDVTTLNRLVTATEHTVPLSNCHDLIAIGSIYRSITGLDPQAPRADRAPVAAHEPFDVAGLVSELAGTRTILYLVGPSGGGAEIAGMPDRLAPWRLSRHVLSRLDLVGQSDEILPGLDLASHYFALAKNDQQLESEVKLFARTDNAIPAIQEALARWIDSCLTGKRKTQHLIVTTNPDLEIERALLVAGVPFARYVQDNVQRNLILQKVPATRDFTYQTSPTEYLESVAPVQYDLAETDPAKPDSRTLELDQMVVLYKLFGSTDCEGSCVRTADRHLDLFAQKAFDAVPKSLKRAAQVGFVFMVGYSLLDAEQRVVSRVFLDTKSARSGLRYFVRAKPQISQDAPSKFELRLWNGFTNVLGENRMAAIDELPSIFFSSLTTGLKRLGAR